MGVTTSNNVAGQLRNFIAIEAERAFVARTAPTGIIQINSVLRDRKQGNVEYLRIYDKDVNLEQLAHYLAEESTREELATFLLSRPFQTMFRKMFSEKPTVRLDGSKLIKTDVIEAVQSVVATGPVSQALCEMIIPILISIGLVSESNKFTVRRAYGHEIPELEALDQDITRQELEHLLADARARVALVDRRTYAVKVIADEFNEAFWPIGKKLRQLASFSTVIRDMVKGVRASIDPQLEGLTGEISKDFVDRAEIALLATNYNFVRAALSIPAGDTIKPTNDDWKLDKWTPIIFALIRNSDRYAMIGREEFSNGFDLKVVRDLRGDRRIAILTEAAQIDPVGMTVIGERDVDVVEAWNLDEPADKVSQRLVATYDQLPKSMNTVRIADMLTDTLRTIVETEIDTETRGIVMNALAPTDVSAVLQVYALFNSERVGYIINDAGYDFVFSVATDDKHYNPQAGYRDVDQITTGCPVELLLVSQEKEASIMLSSRPQLIAPMALNSRLLGLNETDLLPFNQRSGFSFDVMGVKMRGRFDFSELLSMKTGSRMRVVRPWFNCTVVESVMRILENVDAAVNAANSLNPAIATRLKRDLAYQIVQLARAIGRPFRQEIHDMMRTRSTAGLPVAEALVLGSKLRQSSFAALADCFALDVFMRRMGLVESEGASVYSKLANDPEFATILAEYGSDRTDRA